MRSPQIPQIPRIARANDVCSSSSAILDAINHRDHRGAAAEWLLLPMPVQHIHLRFPCRP